MPPKRIGRASLDVTLRVDGDEILAKRGEPVAVALAAAGRLVLGRSVKYHRARGAACYRGRCDGCAMRVEGLPSQRTCRVPARDGMQIETQNVVGSASVDLLSLTDWFFPGGMNHHEMFTWSRPINQVMQSVARQVAGIGTLPDEVVAPKTPERIDVDVLVVGAGASGLHAAALCGEAGLRTLVVDEEPIPGGRAASHGNAAARAPAIERAQRAGARLVSNAAAVGAFEASAQGALVAVDTPSQLLCVSARRVLLATGRNEGAHGFENNDLPGVVGGDAARRLLAHGVLPGERVLVVGDASEELDAVVSALSGAGAELVGPHPLATLRRARGTNHVNGAELEVEGREVRERCDAIVTCVPTSAAFELAGQLGAEVVFRDGVFEIDVGPAGQTASVCARVLGSAAGAEAGALDAIAAAVTQVCKELSA